MLQNKLASHLPAEVLAAHPGAQIIYSLIPQIGKLPSEIRLAVQQTYADGLRTIWYAMLSISALGLLSCLIMQEVEMREALDETWGLQEPSEVQNGRKIDASNTV